MGELLANAQDRMAGLSWWERQKLFWSEMFVPQMQMFFMSAQRGMKMDDLIAEAEIKKEIAQRKEKVAKRVASFEEELVVEWDATWAGVKLAHLPGDRAVKGQKLGQRAARELEERLRQPFFANFQALLGAYHFYTVIDESEVDVYHMTESKWLAFLHEIGVIGKPDEKGKISLSLAATIFKNIVSQNILKEDKPSGGDVQDKAMADSMAAISQKKAERAKVVEHFKEHGAEVLHAFTFSEFIEAIVTCACECRPLKAGEATSVEHVGGAVEDLIHKQILPKASQENVLAFRRLCISSVSFALELERLGSTLDKVFEMYLLPRPANFDALLEPSADGALTPRRAATLAKAKTKAGSPSKGNGAPAAPKLAPNSKKKVKRPAGMALHRFEDMIRDADLFGDALSHMQVKRCFASSMRMASGDRPKTPLLMKGDEFNESILRICLAFQQNPSKAKAQLPDINEEHKKMPAYARISMVAATKGASSLESGVVKNLPSVTSKLRALTEYEKRLAEEAAAQVAKDDAKKAEGGLAV